MSATACWLIVLLIPFAFGMFSWATAGECVRGSRRNVRRVIDNAPRPEPVCDCQHPLEFHYEDRDGHDDACTACWCRRFFVAADVAKVEQLYDQQQDWAAWEAEVTR